MPCPASAQRWPGGFAITVLFCKPRAQTPAVCANTTSHSQVSTAPKHPFMPALEAAAGASPCLRLTPHPCPPPRHVLCHPERDTAAASPICEPEDCQTHLAVSGHPAPLALSHGSRTKPRLCLLLFGHHERPGHRGVAAREHELTVGLVCLHAKPFLEMSAARTCHLRFTALPERRTDVTE